MSLDVMYINKAEEIEKKVHNKDLQSSQDQLQRLETKNTSYYRSEPKGDLVQIPVTINDIDVLTYVMRIGEKMPKFNYWPRGREIIHRLIMKAALTDSPADLILEHTSEDALRSLIF